MWKMLAAGLLAVTPASLAAAQTPAQADLRAAVLAPPATAAAADASARNAADARPGATRLETAHLLAQPSPASPGPAPAGKAPLRLKPASEDVAVDYTFDSADPLDGRFSGDRPGLLGLKGRVKF